MPARERRPVLDDVARRPGDPLLVLRPGGLAVGTKGAENLMQQELAA